MPTKREVKTVRIDKDGRYVMVLQDKGSGPTTMDSELVADIEDSLQTWWNSDRKFYILAVKGIEVRLERVNEPHP